MEITKDIRYVGVNDHQVDLFEGQYVVPNGMSYNSYVILDEKTAVMEDLTEVDMLLDKEIKMEQTAAGKVGKHHTDSDGKKEQRLKLLNYSEVNESERDNEHDDRFQPAPVLNGITAKAEKLCNTRRL